MEGSTLVFSSIAQISSWHHLLVALLVKFAWNVLVAFRGKLVGCMITHSRQRFDHRLGRRGLWRGRQSSRLLSGCLDLLELRCAHRLPWKLLVLLLRSARKLWALRHARRFVLWRSPAFPANRLFGSTYRRGEFFVSRTVAPGCACEETREI